MRTEPLRAEIAEAAAIVCDEREHGVDGDEPILHRQHPKVSGAVAGHAGVVKIGRVAVLSG